MALTRHWLAGLLADLSAASFVLPTLWLFWGVWYVWTSRRRYPDRQLGIVHTYTIIVDSSPLEVGLPLPTMRYVVETHRH